MDRQLSGYYFGDYEKKQYFYQQLPGYQLSNLPNGLVNTLWRAFIFKFKQMNEFPDGIIITISMKSIEEKGGYRNFLKEFLDCMEDDHYSSAYWIKAGNKPRHDVLDVYIVIGGRIRWKCTFVESHKAGYIELDRGRMYGRGWIVCTGPVERPPQPIYKKGFQGFRYTQTLF